MKRIPQLDSIRGIAVLLVLLHNTDKFHYTGAIARNGWMGVDLFFVLSGFLITGILLNTKGTWGYFRNFYARRCLRIWPLYYAALLFMFVLVPLVRPAEASKVFDHRAMPWWSYFIYLQNFLVPTITRATGLLGVTWSLAVEEQFYLVWPLVVRFCSEAQLRRIAMAVICFSPILRFYLLHRHFDVYPNTFCRLDGLMAGALLATLMRSRTLTPGSHTRIAWISLLIALPLALLTARGLPWAAYSFTALSSAALVYLALWSRQTWFQRLLANRFLLYTGMISYGIYLLEKIAPDGVQSLHLDKHPAIVLPATVAATYLLATCSWYLLEKPCLRLKRLFEVEGPRSVKTKDAIAGAA